MENIQAQARLQQALDFHQQGQKDVALTSYGKAIELNPGYAEAYFHRGILHIEAGERELALSDWSKAIELKPDYMEAYFNRGLLFQELGQWEDALEDYDRVIALNPEFAEAYNNKGAVLLTLKQFDAALESLDKAIALNPGFFMAYNNCGAVLTEMGQYELALQVLEKALQLNSSSGDVYNNIGKAFKGNGQLDTALECYVKAIELNPAFAGAYVACGDILYELKQPDIAIEYYKKAVELNPASAKAMKYSEDIDSLFMNALLELNMSQRSDEFDPEALFERKIKPLNSVLWDSNISYIECAFPNLEGTFYNNLPIEQNPDFFYTCGIFTSPWHTHIIARALQSNSKVYIIENCFLSNVFSTNTKNVEPEFLKAIGFTIDDITCYYDALLPSRMEMLLNDKSLVITEEQKARAGKCIDKILSTHLSKYNNQPIYTPEIGREGVPKVLVVDQAYRDWSIIRGKGSVEVFRTMLEKAIEENPDADIIVKTHPETISGLKGGYYTDLRPHDNIYTMTEPINPISLIKYCDKVYVCTTQLGFEALMCGKEVRVFGMPFYAGWGLTRDEQVCERRTNTRTLEEIFYIAYIMYSWYVNPEKQCRCEIEEAMDYLLKLREEYFKSVAVADLETHTKHDEAAALPASHETKQELRGKPWGLIIDTTVLCNNNCSFCWRSNFLGRRNEIMKEYKNNHTMDFETYKKIIDDACQYETLTWLSLCGPMGEPLMNDRIEDFYEYAYKKHHFDRITLNTNGLAINKRDIKRLLNSITEFSVSVDSIDPDTYEKIHGHKNLQQVIDNIKMLVEYEKQNGCVADIWVRFTENELNAGQILEFRESFANLGVDFINHVMVHGFAGVRKDLQNLETAFECDQLPIVNFDFLGNLSTCCINWHLTPTFGNIKDKTLKQLWEGELKMDWNYNRLAMLPCSECSGLGSSVRHRLRN